MSENVIIQHINDVRARKVIWRSLNDEGKRRLLEVAEGSTDMLDELLVVIHAERRYRK